MKPAEVKRRIEALAPGTIAEVTDLTGTEDHYQVAVTSPAFAGKMMVEQHRLVFGTLQAEIDSGEVHALSLKTSAPKV